jgi:hypothetical protein
MSAERRASQGFEAGDLAYRQLQGSQLAVTVPVARGGAAALLREGEPVWDSLLKPLGSR